MAVRAARSGPTKTDRLRHRHVLELPIVLAALAVAGLLAVVNGVFPGPGVEQPVKAIDPALAAEYVGKTVLVDVTQLGADDRPVNAKGWVGRIARLSSEEGIVIEIQGEPPCVLPPDLQYLSAAQPGLYEGHGGEQIADPDFITKWEQRHHGTDEELVCPRWTPNWVSRGYWSARIYSALMELRGRLLGR